MASISLGATFISGHVNAKESRTQQPGSKEEIRVVVSSQDSGGFTQRKFDSNFLKNMEAYTVERIKLKAKEYLESEGQTNTNIQITSEAN